MEKKFTPLKEEEIVVIRLNIQKALDFSSKFKDFTLTLGQLISTIIQSLVFPENAKKQLFDDGLDCQVLRFTPQGWQKGKIRVKLTLEFCPEESEAAEDNQKKNENSES